MASNPDESLPRAFMFHDSFANEVDRLLAEHFSHFVWTSHYGFEAELVTAAKPEVVIELFVERRLALAPPVLIVAQSDDLNRERFQASTRTLYRLDLGAEPCPIDALASTRIGREPRSQDLALTTTDAADTFLLPAMPIPADTSGVLHLSIDSPAETVLDVLYLRESQSQYVRGNSFELPLQAGRNEVYFRFHLPDLHGRLRVRPWTPGTYVLHELELRSIALD
jgi:hypothetical protein